MDSRKKSKSLISMIQTRSLEIVLAPIAKHVTDLLKLVGGEGLAVPDIMPSALGVMEAVQDMANIAQKIANDSVDEDLRVKMPTVSDMAMRTAEKLVEAASRLSDKPTSGHAQKMLASSAQSILEWTVKVCIVWDEGEVRKILNAAQWALDRLGLVQGSKSMRGLVICFGGFSEAMVLLLGLVDKRQKELTDKESKRSLLEALDILRANLPKFTQAMQLFVKTPTAPGAKDNKERLGGTLAAALRAIMNAVYPLNREADSMAGNIVEIQRKLTTDSRYYIGPDLDRHLDAIIQNSMAVAHVSRDQYREAIQKLCGEVLSLRKALQDLVEAIADNPDNKSYKRTFDAKAKQLSERLVELDRWVADSVVDQVTEAFVDPSAPVDHLVEAAISPHGPYLSPGSKSTSTPTPFSTTSHSSSSSPSSVRYDDSMRGLNKQVALFRRHSRKLSQVAAHAAQSSTNAKRVQMIKVLADNVDKLTPRVVDAAIKARRESGNPQAQEQLDLVRRDWAEKVQQLTSAIDDIIDPEDFMAVSEANIQQDMARCREAMLIGSWRQLERIVQGIAAKARRILEFGNSAVKAATDHTFKANLSRAVNTLDRAVPHMLKMCQKLTTRPSKKESHDLFIQSLRDLLEAIHGIQKVLSQEIDVPHTEESEGEEVDTFDLTPSKRTPAQERMLRKNIRRHRGEYIGRLGAADRKHHTTTIETQTEASDLFGGSLSLSAASEELSTQAPSQRSKDKGMQVDLTDSLGTVSPSSTASWTSPKKTPQSDDSSTVNSYVSPLQRLVSSAQKGDSRGISLNASQLSARTIRLTNIAESAAGTLKEDSELAKKLRAKSSRLSHMVPKVIDRARKVAEDPRQGMGELKSSTQLWAGHVKQLVDATQQANIPWSGTADSLVTAAKTGRGVKKQSSHVSTQTERMMSIATKTIEAAATEEAIGSSDESYQSQDLELREQVMRVRVTMSEIEKLTPQFISAAEQAVRKRDLEGSYTMEHLNLLSQEWATKAKVLMKSVDDVSLGMGGAADTLLLAARSGDPTLLEEQSESIQSLAQSLQEIATDAVAGCEDREKVKVVEEAASQLKQLASSLTDTAQALAGDSEESQGHQLHNENSELLRRDWSSQVHLLTAHVDDLTAEVSAPLDRLVDTALQASRTEGPAKDLLLNKFGQQASFINDQLQEVNVLFKKAMETKGAKDKRVDSVAKAISFLNNLSPHAIAAARTLTSDPGSAMLDHFNHLRRQWASKAQLLLTHLREVKSPDLEEVLEAFLELIHRSRLTADIGVQRSYSDEALSDDKVSLTPKGSTPKLRLSEEDSDEALVRPTPQRNKRPVSMIVPLPTWSSTQKENPQPLSQSSRSIAIAAQSLRDVTDVFSEENNPLVGVAKKMSDQMSQMAEFSRGRGQLQTQQEMLDTAKAIAGNGQEIVRFAGIIGDHCTDKTIRNELQYCVEAIPTLSTQLRIISSVKAATPSDYSADVMLVKNAQNLMKVVIKAVQACEAASMKGLRAPTTESDDEEQSEATALAAGWKRKLYWERTMESITAKRDDRGMRKLNPNRISTPSMVDVIAPRKSLLTSPPHRK